MDIVESQEIRVLVCYYAIWASQILLADTRDAGGVGSIPEMGRSPGDGSGNPLQYSCLEISMDRGAWWAIFHGVAKSRIRLSMQAEAN